MAIFPRRLASKRANRLARRRQLGVQPGIARALLTAELPGVELSPDFIYKAVTKDRRKWLNAQKLFWYCQHPQQVKVMDRREWLDHLWQFTDGTVYLPDIRTYSLQVKVLQDIGLFDSIDLDDPERDYSQEGEIIQQLLKRARRRSKAIHTAFHLKVTSKSKPIQFVNRLLGRVGLRLKFHRQIAKGERFYRLDLQLLNDPDRIAVLDSLTQKWEQGSSQPPQQQPVGIYNTEPCCEGIPVSDNSEEANQQESAQVTSEPAFSEPQQQPVEINNTGHCCDFQEIPEECRTDVLAVGAWLAEAARETPEILPAILELAVEYLRAVPQAKAWLWQGMEAWVKETICQLFPDYYHALASP